MRVNLYANMSIYIYIYTYAHVCPDMRNNFCLHLCQKCESSIFPTTCKTGNVFPVSHILPHKVLYKQTKRSEKKKQFFSWASFFLVKPFFFGQETKKMVKPKIIGRPRKSSKIKGLGSAHAWSSVATWGSSRRVEKELKSFFTLKLNSESQFWKKTCSDIRLRKPYR